MSKIFVRKPVPLDSKSMARLLNQIIEQGGTTALTRPVTGDDMIEWMAEDAEQSVWHVAVDDAETVVGFQWICPKEGLPDEACDIATFVQIGRTGLGIGSALFEATKTGAKALGYRWINANIRDDNEGGLIYYQSRGFVDYAIKDNVKLASGQTVTKKLKRFDLYR
ncbi:GNAT family N-acetyltransferase [Algirhabdus cladophorae]|uniref:GNAT family N-acetyltransferase n=1 Tax=Algirhabdus cladophorae TaxID=3377108 RepID=UPI003B84AFF1